MTEKPKETPKEELECPKKYVYDTGIIFECKENSRVEIIGEDVVGLLNELTTKCSKLEKENEQLKAQLRKGEDVCSICKHQYLTKTNTDEYYIAKCKKEHIECSKGTINYCEDFELKGEMNEV